MIDVAARVVVLDLDRDHSHAWLVDALVGSGVDADVHELNRGIDVARWEPVDVVALTATGLGVYELGVIGHARRKLSHAALLVVTETPDEMEATRALLAGADDVVCLPVSDTHVVARVAALTRRVRRTSCDDARLRLGDRLVIDLGAHTVEIDGQAVDLTRREFDLLAYLAARRGRVVRREELLRMVWRSSVEWQRPETVNEHVRRLRNKLESDPANPEMLVTVRGVGYRLGVGRSADAEVPASVIDLRSDDRPTRQRPPATDCTAAASSR